MGLKGQAVPDQRSSGLAREWGSATLLFMRFFFLLFFLITPISHAAGLTAPSLDTVLKQVELSSFSYLGHGLLFGHESVESCAYSAPGILVLDTYCFPETQYPEIGRAHV